ncbi:glycosyl transferase family 2 [Lachnoclostridium phytofermentans ISDg]|uniref:Glycosyl transferase family 2 n=2 Tax=Lachnoclostridium phytofermentans TaxID=66219 RepID=A9KQX9_LACP7|nr:glycosyl transferase family 2 [Lachnoclostridium phytofermentans ISDg]
MSRVDIIMSTYNGEKYLREQIDSILTCNHQNIVLHVFDDGSSDETIQILKEYKHRYENNLHFYKNHRNLGVTKNFLNGIKTVMENFEEAKYFMCCDQDDVWHADKVSKTLKRMEQMEKRYGVDQPLLVFTDTVIVDENLNEISESFFKTQHFNLNKIDLAHLLMENKCIGCTIMINRAFEYYLSQTPNAARYHDWWMALIAAAFGHISYLPKATLDYRQHSANVVGSINFPSYVRKRMSSIKDQKLTLAKNRDQAEEFLHFFHEDLQRHQKSIVEEYLKMFQSNFIKRRYIAINRGYLKSGIVRNCGLMLIL